jgi:hypothetical protein
MSWFTFILRRAPSEELCEARDVHQNLLAQREEVDEVTTSLREGIRVPNGLAPLLEQVLRNTR